MTCKDCLYYEPCSALNAEFKKHPDDFVETDLCAKQCTTFKDRSRFVELPKAHWVRHSPNKNIMREFHKQGIGRGMGENSIFWTCSNCGSWGTLSHKYCSNCGSKIEEAETALKEHEK